MNAIQKRQLKLLNETVAYYSVDKNRRCAGSGGCYYSPESVDKVGISDGCAIGRLLTPELRQVIDAMVRSRGLGVNSYVDTEYIFMLLPKRLQSLGREFLRDLQRLHDASTYWLDNGMSDTGLQFVKKIKMSYELI